MDFIIPNYTIPAQHTVYVNFAFNFNDDTHDRFHIVWAEAIVHQPRHLHHFVVTGCSEKIPEHEVGVPYGSFGSRRECQTPMAGNAFWVPGVKMFSQPLSSGVPVGSAAGIVGFNVNVHYTDANLHPGTVSQDGFRLFYTPTLRPRQQGTLPVMGIGFNPQMFVPPYTARYFVSRECIATMDEPVRVISSFYHAHLIGSEMYQTIIRDSTGERFDLGSQSFWYYNDQSLFNLLGRNITLYPGDRVQSTCVFDSRGRPQATPMSVATTDEMCFATIQVEVLGDGAARSSVRCMPGAQDYVWTGELASHERGWDMIYNHSVDRGALIFEGGRKSGRLVRDRTQDPNFVTASERSAAAGSVWPLLVADLMHQYDLNSDGSLSVDEQIRARSRNPWAMAWPVDYDHYVQTPAHQINRVFAQFYYFDVLIARNMKLLRERNSQDRDPPTQCPEGYAPVDGKCFGGLTWNSGHRDGSDGPVSAPVNCSKAMEMCQAQGAVLPTIASVKQNEAALMMAGFLDESGGSELLGHFADHAICLDMVRSGDEWGWRDGSADTFTMWSEKAIEATDSVAVLDQQGLWHGEGPAFEARVVLCQTPGPALDQVSMSQSLKRAFGLRIMVGLPALVSAAWQA